MFYLEGKSVSGSFVPNLLPLKCNFILRILLINLIVVSSALHLSILLIKQQEKRFRGSVFLTFCILFLLTKSSFSVLLFLTLTKKNEGKRFEAPVWSSHKKNLWYCSLKIYFLWNDICFSLSFFIVKFFEILEPKLRPKLWFGKFFNFEIGYRSFGSFWSATTQPTPRH